MFAVTGSLPSISNTQCTGRTNSKSESPQRMRRAIGIACNALSTSSPSSSAVGRPVSVVFQTSQAPLSVSSCSSALTSTPQERAKPSAGLVGLPSASNAAFSAGPRRVMARSGCWTWTSCTSTASRRGVAKAWLAPCGRWYSSSRLSTAATQCIAHAAQRFRRQFLGTDLKQQVAGRRHAVVSAAIGKPSASRRA